MGRLLTFLNYILIIFFIIGACIPRHDFSQLTKINGLMQHYTVHQKEAQSLKQAVSFIDFIYLHYINCEEHQHDNTSEHENLPFQIVGSTMVLFASILGVDHFEHDLKWTQSLNIFQNKFLEKGFIHSIFHPPTDLIF